MPNPRNPPLIKVTESLRRLHESGIKAYLISGTHDTPKMKTAAGGASPQKIFQAQGHAHVFTKVTKIETHKSTINGQDVVVGGMSTNPILDRGCPLEGKQFPEHGDINILLLHYGIEDHAPIGLKEPLISHHSI